MRLTLSGLWLTSSKVSHTSIMGCGVFIWDFSGHDVNHNTNAAVTFFKALLSCQCFAALLIHMCEQLLQIFWPGVFEAFYLWRTRTWLDTHMMTVHSLKQGMHAQILCSIWWVRMHSAVLVSSQKPVQCLVIWAGFSRFARRISKNAANFPSWLGPVLPTAESWSGAWNFFRHYRLKFWMWFQEERLPQKTALGMVTEQPEQPSIFQCVRSASELCPCLATSSLQLVPDIQVHHATSPCILSMLFTSQSSLAWGVQTTPRQWLKEVVNRLYVHPLFIDMILLSGPWTCYQTIMWFWANAILSMPSASSQWCYQDLTVDLDNFYFKELR